MIGHLHSLLCNNWTFKMDYYRLWKKKSKEERERARRNLAFFFLASFHLPFPGLEKKKKIMDSINGNDNQVSSYQNNSKINDHLKSTYISSNHTIDNNISGKGSI